MVLFTLKVKQTKGAGHRNDDVGGTYESGLR